MSLPSPYADEAALPKVARHTFDLLRLAWPVMISRAGILVMALADITMLGRHEAGGQGVLNLALAVFIPVLVVSIGLVSGMVPVISQAHGAGRWEECGRAWRRAMSWGLVISLIGMMVVWRGETILGYLWQTPENAAKGGAVAVALAPGLVAQVLFAVCAFYLESTRRPFQGLLAMVLANLVNVWFNWLLIFGNAGFPELGAAGAAWASTIARFAAFGLILWFVLSQREPIAAGVRGPWETFWGPGGWRSGWMMRKLGTSAALSNGFETIGFAAMALIAGRISVEAADAYAISHNLVSTFFMVGLGLAVATGVRVGQATGAGHPREAAFAGWTGLIVALAVLGGLAVAVLTFRTEIAGIYTDDAALAARVAGVLAFSAFVFVPDSLQVVLGQAIRALGDAWVAVACYVGSFLVLMVPLGLWMVFGLGWDERGLVLTIAIACVAATVTLAWRFRVLTRLRP